LLEDAQTRDFVGDNRGKASEALFLSVISILHYTALKRGLILLVIFSTITILGRQMNWKMSLFSV
jgi:hypothetical protein